jgi:hypothetical protein
MEETTHSRANPKHREDHPVIMPIKYETDIGMLLSDKTPTIPPSDLYQLVHISGLLGPFTYVPLPSKLLPDLDVDLFLRDFNAIKLHLIREDASLPSVDAPTTTGVTPAVITHHTITIPREAARSYKSYRDKSLLDVETCVDLQIFNTQQEAYDTPFPIPSTTIQAHLQRHIQDLATTSTNPTTHRTRVWLVSQDIYSRVSAALTYHHPHQAPHLQQAPHRLHPCAKPRPAVCEVFKNSVFPPPTIDARRLILLMSDLHKDLSSVGQFQKRDTRPPLERDYLDIFDTHPDHLYMKPIMKHTVSGGSEKDEAVVKTFAKAQKAYEDAVSRIIGTEQELRAKDTLTDSDKEILAALDNKPFFDPQLNGRHMTARMVLSEDPNALASATSTPPAPTRHTPLPVYTPEPEGFYVGTTLDDGSVFGA